MKKLDLNSYGIEAMSLNEMKTTNGGITPLAFFVALYFLQDMAANPRSICQAFMDGCNQ